MEQENPVRKQLERDVKREALRRMEDAARTTEDYNKVVQKWNERDKLNRRRWQRWEIGRPNEEMLHWDRLDENSEKGRLKDWLDTVIPAPLNHEWWRQLLRGDFLDVIHDCPYEMHELTSSAPVFDILRTLSENQMEVLYYWAIRQESPQRIAARRGQTDRNILKVYATLIEGMRKKLYDRLLPRYAADEPLTIAQRRFMEEYGSGKLKTGKPKLEKDKKKRRP